jgi:hypothetical protein
LISPVTDQVKVEVQEDHIVVTLPGTSYAVTYYKPGEAPQLIVRSNWTDDPDASIELGEFRARAWITAVGKARELGWIV